MIRIPGPIPIIIHPFFWVVAGLIGWINALSLAGALIWLGVIFVSVLVHEFGHALTALAFGQRATIELVAFGGLTRREGKRPKLWQEFLIILNGPCFGLTLFGIAYLIRSSFPGITGVAAVILNITIWVNLFWTLINLLPILPLDGGRLMSVVLEGVFGFRGVKMGLVISVAIGLLISIFFFTQNAFIVGILFLLLTFESMRSLRYLRVMAAHDRDEGLQTRLTEVEQLLQAHDRHGAIPKLEELRDLASHGLVHMAATQYLARYYFEEGKTTEAYDMLKVYRKELSGEFLQLFHQLAFENRQYKLAAKIGNEVFQQIPLSDVAYVNAGAHAYLGHVEAAIGWLECALREGMDIAPHHLRGPEFDSIKNHEAFKAFVKGLPS